MGIENYYDKEKLKQIGQMNEKITKEQKKIFDILLQISKTFSDEGVTKKQRDNLFSQVDELKNNVKKLQNELKMISEQQANIPKEDVENEKSEKQKEDKVEQIENTIEELEHSLKELENSENCKENTKQEDVAYEHIDLPNEELLYTSKRKKARTQLVVVDENSLPNKIKGLFQKLRGFMKSK